jgi:hypothetical protein
MNYVVKSAVLVSKMIGFVLGEGFEYPTSKNILITYDMNIRD